MVIEGVVTGDLIVAAGVVEVSGQVQGDVLFAGGRIEITGRVDGSVRGFGGTVEIKGTVGRNVTFCGNELRLERDGRVLGSVIVAGETFFQEASVERDILVGATRHELRGRIGGNALVAGEELSIGRDAEILGTVTFYGKTEPEVSPEARLSSEVTFESVEELDDDDGSGVISFMLKWAAAFLFGAVLVILAPRFRAAVAENISPYGWAMLVGALALLAIPVTAIVVLLTVVGIPIAMALLFIYVVSVYASHIYVGHWIGSETLGQAATLTQQMGRLALGLALIYFSSLIPYAGVLIEAIILIWGLGAIVRTVYDGVRRGSLQTA